MPSAHRQEVAEFVSALSPSSCSCCQMCLYLPPLTPFSECWAGRSASHRGSDPDRRPSLLESYIIDLEGVCDPGGHTEVSLGWLKWIWGELPAQCFLPCEEEKNRCGREMAGGPEHPLYLQWPPSPRFLGFTQCGSSSNACLA